MSKGIVEINQIFDFLLPADHHCALTFIKSEKTQIFCEFSRNKAYTEVIRYVESAIFFITPASPTSQSILTMILYNLQRCT